MLWAWRDTNSTLEISFKSIFEIQFLISKRRGRGRRGYSEGDIPFTKEIRSPKFTINYVSMRDETLTSALMSAMCIFQSTSGNEHPDLNHLFSMFTNRVNKSSKCPYINLNYYTKQTSNSIFPFSSMFVNLEMKVLETLNFLNSDQSRFTLFGKKIRI